jgi:hypothetical protein
MRRNKRNSRKSDPPSLDLALTLEKKMEALKTPELSFKNLRTESKLNLSSALQ